MKLAWLSNWRDTQLNWNGCDCDISTHDTTDCWRVSVWIGFLLACVLILGWKEWSSSLPCGLRSSFKPRYWVHSYLCLCLSLHPISESVSHVRVWPYSLFPRLPLCSQGRIKPPKAAQIHLEWHLVLKWAILLANNRSWCNLSSEEGGNQDFKGDN